MNTQLKLILISLILTLTLTGCGSDSDSDDPATGNGSPSNNEQADNPEDTSEETPVLDNPDETAIAPIPEYELQGTWGNECHPVLGSEQYIVDHVEFIEGNYSGSVTLSQDADCAFPVNSYSVSGSYNVAEDIILSSGITVKAINIADIRRYMTPSNDEVAIAYNSIEFCEHTNWEKDVAFEVTNCPDFDQEESNQVFNIYMIEDGQLFVGDLEADENNDGSTPDKRPAQISNISYNKL